MTLYELRNLIYTIPRDYDNFKIYQPENYVSSEIKDLTIHPQEEIIRLK